MSIIIKGSSKDSITIILTDDGKYDDFISSLKDGEMYEVGMMGVKNPEKQISKIAKVCVLEEIERR